MEENLVNAILLGILMLFFACVVGTFDDNIDVQFKPFYEQKDNLFNKWRRIY